MSLFLSVVVWSSLRLHADGATSGASAAVACQEALDPLARVRRQLNRLMPTEKLDVTNAVARLTCKEDLGIFNIVTYVPFNIETLDGPGSPGPTPRRGFLQKLGLRRDSSDSLVRMGLRPNTLMVLVDRENRALWARYFFHSRPLSKWDADTLIDLSQDLFSGDGPLQRLTKGEDDSSPLQRHELYLMLSAFISDHWDGRSFDGGTTSDELVRDVLHRVVPNVEILENKLARDYVSGFIAEDSPLLGFLTRTLSLGQIVKLIVDAGPSASARLQKFINGHLQDLGRPRSQSAATDALNSALADPFLPHATKALLVHLIRLLPSTESLYETGLSEFFASAAPGEALEALLAGPRLQLPLTPYLLDKLLERASGSPVFFKDAVQRALDLLAVTDAPESTRAALDAAIDRHLPDLTRRMRDPSYISWALDVAKLRARAGHPQLFNTIAAISTPADPSEKFTQLWKTVREDEHLDLSGFIETVVFQGRTPSLQMLAQWIERFAGDPDLHTALVDATGRRLARDANLVRADLRRYWEFLPELKDRLASHLASSLARGEGRPPLLTRSLMLRQQPELERALGREVESRRGRHEPSSSLETLARLPRARRYAFVKDLLADQRTSSRQIVEIISALEPEDGVREAVTEHLAQSHRSHSPAFTDAQLRRMFGRGRLTKFFPRLYESAQVDEGDAQTAFDLALRSTGREPSRSLAISDFEDDLVRMMNLEQSLGFRPIDRQTRLGPFLQDAPDGLAPITPAAQLRGLVVQGHYERRGHSILVAPSTRGAAQVEVETVFLNRAIETGLSSGLLKDERRLVRRLLASYWAVRSDRSLIERMRQRAAFIAYIKGAEFWELRVQIHNFPNQAVLAKVKEYRDSLGRFSPVRPQLTLLIRDIEQVLNPGEDVPQSLAKTLARVAGPVGLRLRWKHEHALSDSEPAVIKLRRLVTLREKLAACTTFVLPLVDNIDVLLGDRTLSDSAQAIGAREIARVRPPTSAAEFNDFGDLLKVVVDHVVLDDFLTSDQGVRLKERVDELLHASEFSPGQRVEALLKVIQTAIDQSQQTLEREFGRFDRAFSSVMLGQPRMEPFLDDVLRGSQVLMLSHLADRLNRPVEVFNPGRATGIMRLNADASRVGPGDIPVFTSLPPQIDPVAGILTLAAGSRLSHLQLLSRSLAIPNARIDRRFLEQITHLDGKMVILSAGADGTLDVREATAGAGESAVVSPIVVPKPDRSVAHPVLLSRLARPGSALIAGPKSLNLARLLADPRTRALVPDGIILPFGFFERYVGAARLRPLLRNLRLVNLDNPLLVARLAESVRRAIAEAPIPAAMLAEIEAEAVDLGLPPSRGLFVRSDTNLEDLEDFNGAGLNESVPNVPQTREDLDRAIRKVWASAFTERSISWRARAVASKLVVIAEPSVLIQPTVDADSSGVITSRGTDEWRIGRGLLNADAGISGVVETNTAVEEWTFAGGVARRLSSSNSSHRRAVDPNGGLRWVKSDTEADVLSRSQAELLNATASEIEAVLGDRSRGWDIEWAFENGVVRILQARPNF